jgi:opacity protein-like surface antigen
MKRIPVLSLALILLLSAGAAAGAVDFGIKGGVNISNVYGDDVDEDAKWKTGFKGGAFLDLGIARTFAVRPELLFVQDGSKSGFLGGDLYLKFNYLQVPVLAVVDLPVGGSLMPFLFAGPYISFLLDSELELKVDDESATKGLKDYTKSTDTGFVFGAGLDFGLGQGRFSIEGRYDLGLGEFDDGIAEGLLGIEDAGRSDGKNQSWTIMIGYTF